MSSFYGGNGGVTSKVVNSLISDSSKKAKRHIVASESEPFGQQVGDLWLVLEKDENENKTRVDLTYNSAEGIFEGQIETGIMTAAQLEAGYDFYGEIDGNEVSFMVAEITDQPDCTLIKLFSPMVEGIVECGYYYKTGRITKRLRAILDDGLKTNLKLKILTGSINQQYYDIYLQLAIVDGDSKVQEMGFVDNLFDNFEPTEMNTISSIKSDVPIYTKWDNSNKIINIYSEVNELQCDINSTRYLFIGFKTLSESSIIAMLEKINCSNVNSLEYAFGGTKITTIPNIINISHLTNMYGSFASCKSLVDISLLSNLDTSQISSFSHLFERCLALTDLSSLENWDTSKVTNMSTMFGGQSNAKMNISNIQALRNWDVSNVTNMWDMFAYNESLIDISPLENWNVSKVEFFRNMFGNTGISNVSALANWDVSNAIHMHSMFSSDTNLTDISALVNWDVSNVTGMDSMFYGDINLTDISALANWDVSNVTSMLSMFNHTSILDISPLANWNVSNVTGMDGMFSNNTNLINISALVNWDVSNVTGMGGLFQSCSSLSDISALENWNVSNVTNLGTMFRDCNLITVSLPNWDIRKVTATHFRYPYYYGLGQMFANNPNLEQVYLTNWDFSNVKSMANMFENTPKLQHVYVSQASYDSFLRAVDNGCNITDMWKNSNISQFTIIDS